MTSQKLKRLLILSVVALLGAALVLTVEWFVIRALAPGNPVEIFANVGTVGAVVAGVVIGRVARSRWRDQS